MDGVPCYKTYRPYPVYRSYPLNYWRDQLYVNPETGILCIIKKLPKKLSEERDDVVLIDSYHQYRKLNDVWYLVTLQDIPGTEKPRDVVLKVALTPGEAQREYGREVYAVSKQQCSKKEIKYIMQQLAKK